MTPKTPFSGPEPPIPLIRQLHPDSKLPDVIDAVKEYWGLPWNTRDREDNSTINENGYRIMASLVRLDEGLPRVIESAKSKRPSWDALRDFAYGLVQEGLAVPPEALEVLLRPEGPPHSENGRPKGQKPAMFYRDWQLAHAVYLVYVGTGGNYSLDALGTSAKNAFYAVADATGLGFETVRKAYNKETRLRKKANEKIKKGTKAR